MNLTNIEEMQDRLNELMELPKDKFPSVLKLVEDVENLYKENKQLKKEIQKLIKLLDMFKNQQKEFIEWLEENIKACELTSDLIFNHNKEKKIYKEIISKYKQIEKLGLIEKE